jgi:hypothetical protein
MNKTDRKILADLHLAFDAMSYHLISYHKEMLKANGNNEQMESGLYNCFENRNRMVECFKKLQSHIEVGLYEMLVKQLEKEKKLFKKGKK